MAERLSEEQEQRIARFTSALDGFQQAPEGKKDGWAALLVNECVVDILRSKGRAIDPTPAERSGGFSLKPEYEDEQVLAAHGQLFRFSKGEFPAYDQVLNRRGAWALGNHPGRFSPELDHAILVLAEEAQACLGLDGDDE